MLYRGSVYVLRIYGWQLTSTAPAMGPGHERERGERALRRVQALIAPLTPSSVMASLSLSLSLSECCEIAGRCSAAEDSEETNGLLIQSAER